MWANSPWPDSYESVWTTKLSIRLGDSGISLDLRDWVNEGLMTFFFLVVGLEAERELDLGELRDRARLALPVVAALGGMASPSRSTWPSTPAAPGAHGWGAAMSTDTAFALGLLALAAPRGATRLRVFLLTLAVVDDLCALLVIATVYSEHVSLTALAVAIGLFGVLIGLRYAPVGRSAAAAVVGAAIWVAHVQVGHPPDDRRAGDRAGHERLPAVAQRPRARQRDVPVLPRAAHARARAQRAARLTSAISANERLQYRLHPWTSYAIVPLFALSNAGITFSGGLLGDALRSPVTLGIVVGYVVGKPAGITGASWLATRRVFGGQRLPVSWPGLAGMGAVAGIGFTVSLLISSIAFHGQLLEEAKIGILAGAILSALSAWGAFRLIALIPAPTRARQLSGTADELLDLADDVDPERRPPARQPRRARGPARVRRLRVPVLRPGRDRHPRAARVLRRRALLRLAPPPAQRRPLARADGRRGGRGRGRPGPLLGDARHAASPTRTSCCRCTSAATPRSWASTSTACGTRCTTASTRRASAATSPAPTRAASQGRRPSSSTAGATRAPTTSRRSAPRCAPPSAR